MLASATVPATMPPNTLMLKLPTRRPRLPDCVAKSPAASSARGGDRGRLWGGVPWLQGRQNHMHGACCAAEAPLPHVRTYSCGDRRGVAPWREHNGGGGRGRVEPEGECCADGPALFRAA